MAKRIHFTIQEEAGIGRENEVVRLSIPLKVGMSDSPAQIRVVTKGKETVAQGRALSRWPDGSVKWLLLHFPVTLAANARQKAFIQAAKEGPGPDHRDGMVRRTAQGLVVDTGRARFTISRKRFSVFQQVRVGNSKILSPQIETTSEGRNIFPSGQHAHFNIVDKDGKTFSTIHDHSPSIEIVEDGPWHTLIRVRGDVLSKDRGKAVSLDLRYHFYKASSTVRLLLTYIINTSDPSLFFRDMRLSLPHTMSKGYFEAGCGFGDVYSDLLRKGNVYYLLQDDHDFHNLWQENPEYGTYPVASSGVRGKQAPGFFTVTGSHARIFVHLENFWQSYPKEIQVTDRELSIAIWPQRAIKTIAAKPQLPEPKDRTVRFENAPYVSLMPMPYFSGYSPKNGSYEMPCGISRTHDLVFDFSAGTSGDIPNVFDDGNTFRPYPVIDVGVNAREQHARVTHPLIALPEPAVYGNVAELGPLRRPVKGSLNQYEQMLEETFCWFQRVQNLYSLYGELDWGDLPRHLHTARMKSNTKGHMGQEDGFYPTCHPRAGWWNNGERDTARGFYIQFLRTGRRDYLHQFRAAIQHNMEVDNQKLYRTEHSFLGLIGHIEGHCFRSSVNGADFDHTWCSGMLDYFHLTGDPRAHDLAQLLGKGLIERWTAILDDPEPGKAPHPHHICHNDMTLDEMHPRLFFRVLWEYSVLYGETGDEELLPILTECVAQILIRQKADGYFSPMSPRSPHYQPTSSGAYAQGGCLMALLKYFIVSQDLRVLDAMKKGLAAALGNRAGTGVYQGEKIPKMAGEQEGYLKMTETLAYLIRETGQDKYVKMGHYLLQYIHQQQDHSDHPLLRGNWNDAHRAMPYRAGNALQHVPHLLSAVADKA